MKMANFNYSNNELYESFGKTAANIIKYFGRDERKSMLRQLRQEVEKLCSIEQQMNQAKEIEKEFTRVYNEDEYQEEDKTNFLNEYNNRISQISINTASNKNLIDFDKIVSALENDADGKDGADEEGDADLQLTRNTINVIDPITKKRMTDPVKNIICDHTYERESVAALIQVNPHTRCPVPGCKYKEYLSMSNMRSDIVTKTYLQKHQS